MHDKWSVSQLPERGAFVFDTFATLFCICGQPHRSMDHCDLVFQIVFRPSLHSHGVSLVFTETSEA